MKNPPLICKECQLMGRQKHSYSCQLLLAIHMRSKHDFSLRNLFGFVELSQKKSKIFVNTAPPATPIGATQ